MKKIASLVGSAALLLSMAAPAFACTGSFCFWMPKNELTVENSFTNVTTNVYTKTDTGDNEIGGKYVYGGKIWTGDAVAVTDVSNTVNLTDVAGCDCYDDVTVKNMFTTVNTDVTTKSYTGDNEIGGYKVGSWFGTGPKVYTGSATSASTVVSQVNLTIVGDVVE